VLLLALGVLARQHVVQPLLLAGVQEIRRLRPLGQEEIGDDAHHHGRDAGGDEHPFPALQAEHAVEVQQRAADGRADGVGQGAPGHEQPDHAAAVHLREP
jgi:hypothetical protein